MCWNCEQNVEVIRPLVDDIIRAETRCRAAEPDLTEAQHALRLATTLVEAYEGVQNIAQLALSFSVTIQRLIALQQITGMPVP